MHWKEVNVCKGCRRGLWLFLSLIIFPCISAFAQATEDLPASFDQHLMNDYPIARNIWNLLQTQHLASVPDRIDEGGFQTGISQLMGVHGGTWTQNGYRWDGVNITNPYEPGKP